MENLTPAAEEAEKGSSAAARLVLASASPRRRELLLEAGYAFDVDATGVDESAAPQGLAPADLAVHLAMAKAAAVAQRRPGDLVLGADTVVSHAHLILGKPADAAAARAMLKLLGGTTHAVITGIALVCVDRGIRLSRSISSLVHMRRLTDAEIDAYVAGGQWQGKAGGYGLQDHDPFVTCTCGSHTNIVGLPMEATREMLELCGVKRT